MPIRSPFPFPFCSPLAFALTFAKAADSGSIINSLDKASLPGYSIVRTGASEREKRSCMRVCALERQAGMLEVGDESCRIGAEQIKGRRAAFD